MQTTIKRLLSLVLCLALVLGMGLPTVARAAETSGTTGDVNWSYADGVLTLSGTGATATDYGKTGQPWQSYMTQITKVVVEEGVTVLGQRLFFGASALTDVTIPKGVTTIGAECFRETAIAAIDLPDTLTEVGNGAFRLCKNLKSVTFPDSLTTLGRTVFYDDSSLTSVTLGSKDSKLTTMGDQVFTNAKALTELTVPASLTKLTADDKGKGSFYKVSATAITFLGTQAQWHALVKQDTALQTDALTVTCSDGKYVYGSYVEPTDPTDPVEPTDPEKPENPCGKTGDIDWTLDLDTGVLTLSGKGKTADYKNKSGQPWNDYKLSVKKVVIEEGVTYLGDRLFYEDKNLTEVVFPATTLTTIGEGTFRACDGLTEITLPDSLTTIKRVAFYQSINLKKVVLGSEKSRLTTLNDQTFTKCNALTEIVMPASVVHLEGTMTTGPFHVTPLETITYLGTIAQYKALLAGTNNAGAANAIENMNTARLLVHCTDGDYRYGQIGGGLSYAISGTALLLNYDGEGTGLMDDFTSFGETPWAAQAGTITRVVLKYGVKRLGANAFSGLTGVKDVVFFGTEADWKAIETASGAGNEPVFSVPVTYPLTGSCGENVTYTYEPVSRTMTISGTGEMYNGWTSGSQTPWYYVREEIRHIVIGEGVTSVGSYAFNVGLSVESVEFPTTLQYVGTFSFGQCSRMTSFTLPEGLTIIGSKAFRGCSAMTEIHLPSTLVSVDLKAFEDATVLSDVYYNGTENDWSKVLISTSASGNDKLIHATFHFLKTDAAFSDTEGKVAEAAVYLTGRGYLDADGETFGAADTADLLTVVEALYRKAGKPGMYENSRLWAINTGLIDTASNEDLTLGAMAELLRRFTGKNGHATGTDALAWAAENGYLADCTAKNASDALTRADMALILAAYLQSDNANADRLDAQRKVIRDALAQGGDGKMYLFVPELNVPGKASKPGDCTFLVFPDGQTMLLDTGVNTCADQIADMLKDFGVKELDYLVISHPHIDHVGGAVTAVEYLKSIGGTVKHFWHSPADLKNYVANVEAVLPADTQIDVLLSGEVRTIGDVTVNVYNPSREFYDAWVAGGDLSDGAVNNVSLALKFTYGDSSFLSCGDLYTNQERSLAAQYGDALRADIFNTNHHGAYTSNCDEWLDAVQPKIMFVESDDIGDTILAQRAAERNCAFYAAGLDGDILITMGKSADYTVTSARDSGIRSDYNGSVGKEDRLLIQPEITFGEIGTLTEGDADFLLPVSGGAEGLTFTYVSDNENVATVDENGLVHLVGAGEVTLTVTKSGEGYETVTASVTLTVNKKAQEPKPTEPKPTEPKPTEPSKPGTVTPATGDPMNMTILTVVLIVAAIGVAVLLFFLLRKKKK